MMKKRCFAAVMFVALNFGWLTASTGTKMKNLPRLPGAMLLLGYPPFSLAVTTKEETKKLQDDAGTSGSISPSISADGSIVASAHRISGDPFSTGPRLMVSTYSMADNQWTDHQELEVVVGSIAISPDGSQLACFTRKMPGAPAGLRILDLKSGKVTAGPDMPERAGAGISWSPDGRRIVFDRDIYSPADADVVSSIYVLDLASGTVSKIAEGDSPSWSPSGDWIAFVYTAKKPHSKIEYRVTLMHPDGTASRVLRVFHQDVAPNLKPVWSPASNALLLNESRNPDENTWNVYLLDIATLKLTKKFKNVPPVYAWAAAK
jgi:dipeptidyl aminopeptidase/acylaminoacyl peptidase